MLVGNKIVKTKMQIQNVIVNNINEPDFGVQYTKYNTKKNNTKKEEPSIKSLHSATLTSPFMYCLILFILTLTNRYYFIYFSFLYMKLSLAYSPAF